jgi:hypothetical protein
MDHFFNFTRIIFAITLPTLWFSAWFGTRLRTRSRSVDHSWLEDFDLILASTLTLLGLIIGFTFSMAVSRYDQRKNCEAEESNTIGTEYLRVGLLPDADKIKVRALLKQYLALRMQFYLTGDRQQLRQIKANTDQLQNELWLAVKAPAMMQPNALTALVVSGMNATLDAQGYTQAAWLNHIPTAAWILMVGIAVLCNLLVGFRAPRTSATLLMILPLAVALAFFLIADIDSPVAGRIQVRPQNLEKLYESMQ